MKYELIREFDDCVLLRRTDSGTYTLRDNEGDVLMMNYSSAGLENLVAFAQRYSLDEIRQQKMTAEREWRERNVK